jgi:hypothetical protein
MLERSVNAKNGISLDEPLHRVRRKTVKFNYQLDNSGLIIIRLFGTKPATNVIPGRCRYKFGDPTQVSDFQIRALEKPGKSKSTQAKSSLHTTSIYAGLFWRARYVSATSEKKL